MIKAVSPQHGRALIYVWAIEQDELSKRAIPKALEKGNIGEDVFVPWVMSKELQAKPKQRMLSIRTPGNEELTSQNDQSERGPPLVFNRYYHMFAHGELTELVMAAASELGLHIGPATQGQPMEGIEIIQDGWERSNYYVELRRWKSS